MTVNLTKVNLVMEGQINDCKNEVLTEWCSVCDSEHDYVGLDKNPTCSCGEILYPCSMCLYHCGGFETQWRYDEGTREIKEDFEEIYGKEEVARISCLGLYLQWKNNQMIK